MVITEIRHQKLGFYQNSEYSLNHNTETSIIDSKGRLRQSHNLMKPSRYADHLRNWYHYFDRSKIFIIDSEEVRKAPIKMAKKLEKFLELEPEISDRNFYFNETKVSSLQKSMNRTYFQGFFCLKDVTHQVPVNKCLSNSKGRKHPDISITLR